MCRYGIALQIKYCTLCSNILCLTISRKILGVSEPKRFAAVTGPLGGTPETKTSGKNPESHTQQHITLILRCGKQNGVVFVPGGGGGRHVWVFLNVNVFRLYVFGYGQVLSLVGFQPQPKNPQPDNPPLPSPLKRPCSAQQQTTPSKPWPLGETNRDQTCWSLSSSVLK